MLVQPIDPKIITIVTTYKCTAACRECCFQCSPKINVRLTYEEINRFITTAVREFKDSIQLCVFTGGECTLLGEDLFKSIKLAKSMGLMTRIVTNGFWARTEKTAKKMVLKLKEAGLDEINYSTGDNHLEWIDFNTIKNAVLASCSEDITTLVSIETFNGARFDYNSFISDKMILNLIENSKLQVVNASWIPMKNEELLKTYERELDDKYNYKGCDSLLAFLGLNPFNEVISCCGITMEYIESMKLGKISKDNLRDLHYNQFNDFLKIWIFTEGPEKILYFASDKNEKLKKYTKNIVHSCQACAYIYNSKDVQKTLLEHYKEVIPNILLKYELKMRNYN